LDLNGVEQRRQVEALDLGPLRLGRAVGDQGELHAEFAERLNSLQRAGEELGLLLAIDMKALAENPGEVGAQAGRLRAEFGKALLDRQNAARAESRAPDGRARLGGPYSGTYLSGMTG